jgi:endogenous inhibitor of DNA gyrase (YacG/DUF329 family)
MTLVRCPTCNRLFESGRTAAMPFCSARCQNIDLYRWLDEQYGLPVEIDEAADQAEQTADGDLS